LPALKLAYRALVVFVVVMSLAVSSVATARLRPGTYSGRTSDGIEISITLNRDRQTGTFTYCEAQAAPFTLTDKSFQIVVFQEDGVTPQVQANGTFRKRKVTGEIPIGGGCNGTPQTFSLRKG
jgi:hypothetical protein